MIAALLIVFREVLEAALAVAVILGATKGLKGRGKWAGWGIGAGVLGALIVAAFMGRISQSLSGIGQPIFEAVALLSAVLMLGWHNVWMSQNGRRIAADLRRLGQDLQAHRRHMAAIFLAVFTAVMREGSEIVLFLYGVSASGAGKGALCAGGALGLFLGVLLGFAVYQGLMKIPLRHFFRVTGWMILLLAAGMAAQAAAFLNQAGLLPSLGNSLWDTSWILSAQSLAGTALKTLVGYTPNPSGLQFLFYAATLLVIGGLMKSAKAED